MRAKTSRTERAIAELARTKPALFCDFIAPAGDDANFLEQGLRMVGDEMRIALEQFAGGPYQHEAETLLLSTQARVDLLAELAEVLARRSPALPSGGRRRAKKSPAVELVTHDRDTDEAAQ